MSTWILKTEPSAYSFETLVRDGRAVWDGIKNPTALKNLSKVKAGDSFLIYHTGSVRAGVGLARATSDSYPDPKKKNPKLLVVDLVPEKALARPVTLAEIKADPRFKDTDLVRLGRVSVLPAPAALWREILRLAEKPLPSP